MSIRGKLTAIVLTPIVAFAGIISTIVFVSNMRTMEREIKKRLSETSYHIIDKIDRMLFERYADIQSIARDPVISSGSSTSQQITKRLITYKNTYKSYLSLSFFDINRTRVADTSGLDIGETVERTGYWEEVEKGEVSAASYIMKSETLEKTVIFFSSPVRNETGTYIGAVVARMGTGEFHAATKGGLDILEGGKPLNIDLVDKNGILIYSNHQGATASPKQSADWDAIAKKTVSRSSGSFVHTDAEIGKKFLYFFVREMGYIDFRGNGWTLFVSLPEDSAYASVADLRNRMILILLPILVISASFSLLFSRSLAKRIGRLKNAVGRLALGKIDETIVSNLKDEIGDLTRSFNTLTVSLREIERLAQKISHGDLTGGVQPRSEKDVLGNALARMISDLKRQVSDIIEGTNVIATSTTEITAAASQLVAGSSETATSISQTTATVEEVKQASKVANEKAKEVSDAAKKSMQHSQRGQEAVKKVVEGMGSIKDGMEQLAGDIMNLSDQSHAIGQITATVNDIAEQTNLLSVNAAIEAMKAGEYGKGFSVVAGEIKSLSEQSKRATTQVKTILNDIQKAIGKAVMATEEGSKVIEAGVRQSEEAGETIEVLAQNIVGASEASTQIAASSQQQLVGMDQVAMAMVSIREASVQNVNSTRQVEDSAKNLHELGQRLKNIVKKYIV
jgi:methyl-accepting chemotaxis protein